MLLAHMLKFGVVVAILLVAGFPDSSLKQKDLDATAGTFHLRSSRGHPEHTAHLKALSSFCICKGLTG